MASTQQTFLQLLGLLGWIAHLATPAAHVPVWEPMEGIISIAAAASSSSGQSIRLPLYNVRDILYYFKIQVGTPPQTVRVVFDTAPSDIGVTTIKSDAHKIYNHSQSSTYKPDGRVVKFRDGMEGELVQDRLGLLGDVAAQDQHFVEITNVSSYGQYYSAIPFDGWFGVGQNETQSVGGFPTYVRMLHRLGVLDRPCVFVSTPRDKNGQIVFGSGSELDEEQYEVVPTDPHAGLWGFDVSDITVGNVSISMETTSTANKATVNLGYAALDNTRPYIVGPADAVSKIADLVNATASPYGIFSVPCEAKLPDISFWAAGTPPDAVFTLLASDLIGRRVSQTDCEFLVVQRMEADTKEIADWAMGVPVFHRYNFGFCWCKIPGGTPFLTKALQG